MSTIIYKLFPPLLQLINIESLKRTTQSHINRFLYRATLQGCLQSNITFTLKARAFDSNPQGQMFQNHAASSTKIGTASIFFNQFCLGDNWLWSLPPVQLVTGLPHDSFLQTQQRPRLAITCTAHPAVHRQGWGEQHLQRTEDAWALAPLISAGTSY